MNVGIWGYGFVGQAQHHIISDFAKVTIYDIKDKYRHNERSMLDQDIIFVCVPTPKHASGKQDASILTLVLQYLYSNNYKGIVVVKSTALWSNLSPYENLLNLCYNPEFLNQNTSFEDAGNQKLIILGGSEDVNRKVEAFYEDFTWLDNPDFEFMSIKEASDFKYTRNLYSAYKVLFWEFIQDTTGNSRKMSSLYDKLPLKDSYLSGLDGFRGFGGACLPKDTQAWNSEHKHELTKFIIDYNTKLNE